MLNDNLKTWRRFSGTFSFSEDEPIDKVTIEIVADDSVCRNDLNEDVPIYITDLHFQGGETLSGWVPETREFTKKLLHTNDETKFRIHANDIYLGGKTPVKRTNLEFLEHNIAGRGNEVFTIPNWYPDNWFTDILPTGIDLEITPKDDYDLMRVCTNYGSLKDPEEWYKGDDTHPLSIGYTREFTIGAGLAGVPIKILARSGKAFQGASRIPIGGVNSLTLSNGETFPIKPRSFLIAQKGAIRIRFEFYKFKDGILTDTGVGYQGTTKFNQWTFGRSRV
jgi:hypothetical protein